MGSWVPFDSVGPYALSYMVAPPLHIMLNVFSKSALVLTLEYFLASWTAVSIKTYNVSKAYSVAGFR
jgi:hypothetical protein